MLYTLAKHCSYHDGSALHSSKVKKNLYDILNPKTWSLKTLLVEGNTIKENNELSYHFKFRIDLL